jgi:hypothetical protein
MRASPARCRIRRRDKLGRDLSRSAEGCIIEDSQVLINRVPRSLSWKSLFTLDTSLPIGVRLDQAGIDRKGFTANQTFPNATLQNRLEHAPQQIALTEAAMPILREG